MQGVVVRRFVDCADELLAVVNLRIIFGNAVEQILLHLIDLLVGFGLQYIQPDGCFHLAFRLVVDVLQRGVGEVKAVQLAEVTDACHLEHVAVGYERARRRLLVSVAGSRGVLLLIILAPVVVVLVHHYAVAGRELVVFPEDIRSYALVVHVRASVGARYDERLRHAALVVRPLNHRLHIHAVEYHRVRCGLDVEVLCCNGLKRCCQLLYMPAYSRGVAQYSRGVCLSCHLGQGVGTDM